MQTPKTDAIGKLNDTLLLHYLVSQDYESQGRDYGLNDLLHCDVRLHSIEIHLLAAIDENPGISAQELAQMFFRSKGAISQRLKVLSGYRLISRETSPDNHRVSLLYTTEYGKAACRYHTEYDRRHNEACQAFLEGVSEQELETCSRIVMQLTQAMHRERCQGAISDPS